MAISSWASALSRRLSRETSSGRFLPEIDGLRFVAIATVMAYHLVGYIQLRHGEQYGGEPPRISVMDHVVYEIAEVGDIGVQLFFGISGFILCLPFAEAHLFGQPRPTMRRYLARRVTRLEPPYLINLLVWYVALIVVKGGSATGLIPHLLASACYLHNWLYAAPSRINGVAWTLEIEVQFYLLAPLLARVFMIRSSTLRRGLLLTAMIIVPVIKLALITGDCPAIRLSLLGQLQFFLVGFLLVDFYLVSWNKQPSADWHWDGIGLAAWIALLSALLIGHSLLRESTSVLILIAYMAAFRGRIWQRVFRCTPLVIIGGMCYTIYLYQWIGFYTFGFATMRLYNVSRPYWMNYLTQFVLLVPLTIAFCAVMFVLFEKPFMRRDWVKRTLHWLDRTEPTEPRK